MTATASIRIIFARRRGPRGERRRWHLQIRDSAKRKKTIAGRQQTKDVVVDWKSDVRPTEATMVDHAAQIADYLQLSGAPRGALFYMTTGEIRWVQRVAVR